jgi:DNA adenine methylase
VDPSARIGDARCMSAKIPQSVGYLGAKASDGVFQKIIGQMPPHEIYVEPFFGSGQIFWRKRLALQSVLIDKNAATIEAVDQHHTDLFPGHQFNFLVGNGITYLEDHNFQFTRLNKVLIYCDPPYLLSTRSSRYRYEHEMTEEDHERLLARLNSVCCNAMISGYPSPLYKKMLQDWRKITYLVRTRGGTKIECLWCSFAEPEILHDWRCAGKNFRQRLYLNRMKKRWLGKLERMAPRQRGFILDAIGQRWT